MNAANKMPGAMHQCCKKPNNTAFVVDCHQIQATVRLVWQVVCAIDMY